MNHSRRIAVIVLVMLSITASMALTGGVLIGTVLAYSGGTSASPNPAQSSQSVTVYCSWNAYKRSGYGWNTVYCKVDGVTWYSSNVQSGTASKVFPPYYFSAGSHVLEVDYSVGMTTCNRAPCYAFAKVTAFLTVDCTPKTITLTFWIFHAGGQMLNFGGNAYQNGQSVSVAGGCGQPYSIKVWYLIGYNFYEWATDTDGIFASTSLSHSRTNPDTFKAGSYGGNIVMVLDDWGSVSYWAGYIAYSATNSFNSVQAQFQIPTSLSYYSFGGGGVDEVAFWLGIGGAWATPSNFWQAGIIMYVNSAGTVTLRPFYEQCFSDGTCNPPQTPWSYTAAPGDYIRVAVYSFNTPDSACLIEDLGNPPGADKWFVSSTTNPPCKVANFQPDQSTAEWIVEMPWGGAGPNIGPVTFTSLIPYWATPLDNTEQVPPQTWCPQKLVAGDISGTGYTSQFTVTYTNLGAC